MKRIFLVIIFIYQKLFSVETGLITTNIIPRRSVCSFYPSCSEYTRLSIIKYGALRGLFLGLKRIGKCGPFQSYKIDQVV